MTISGATLTVTKHEGVSLKCLAGCTIFKKVSQCETPQKRIEIKIDLRSGKCLVLSRRCLTRSV